MNLSGKTILITRAADQAKEFADLVKRFGGTAIVFPTIAITSPDSWEACDKAIDSLYMYDGLIFTSVNGVEFFFRRTSEKNISVQDFKGKMAFVVGEKTKQSIERYGLNATTMPEKFTALELASKLRQEDLKGKCFLFPRGNLGKDILQDNLRILGAQVDAVTVYQTMKPKQTDIDVLQNKLINSEIDVITFTSPSTFQNFLAMFSYTEIKNYQQHTKIAVIGPVTANAVETAGLDVDIQPKQSTIESLIDAIYRAFSIRDILMINDLFLQACLRQPISRTPVWMMRQAGRYLPEYRAVRSKADFLTICKTPELAAEVTIQPVDIIGVDAAIIFSDILVVPEAMGMELIVEEGKGGPQFPSPLRSQADITKLVIPDPTDRLKYVMDAISLTRRQLNGRVPLIGFSGSPWTLASYMVEGHGSKNFRYIKEMIYNEPKQARLLLGKLAKVVAAYLSAQIEAGAQAVQIFDTWGGILTQDDFQEFSLGYIKQVINNTKTNGAPIIVFCKDCGHSLEKVASIGCNVVGLDWTIDIGDARKLVGDRVALQGNMDPTILYAKPERIREEVKSILSKFGKGSGHIFNLGHGILPDIPVEHAKEFIQAVKEESTQYHK